VVANVVGREWVDFCAGECHDPYVATAADEVPLAAGYEALAAGHWEQARDAFAAVADATDSAEALDGLARALWWLRDARGAAVQRERAYAGFRRNGELARAARVALWLAREYALTFGNDVVAQGWLARAERLLKDVAPGAEQGWLVLAHSERARDPQESTALAGRALDVAQSVGDLDLELRALAQLGLAEVSSGHVDAGLSRLDEAMAAATAGEAASLETFADVFCTLMLACELADDAERPQQWSAVLEDFVRKYDPVTLLAFCRTCCADVLAANGRIDAAEEELVAAIRELSDSGQRSRCVHPTARLAEIRVVQGRFDEAEALLAGFEEEPEAVSALVSLRTAQGRSEAAAALLEERLDEVGRSSLLAAPLYGQLVETYLVSGDMERARTAASWLARIAEGSGRERVDALALFARARISAALAEPSAATLLRQAVNAYAALGLRLETARARLELARALASESAEVAVDIAKRARNELDGLGATCEADAAASLMRSLGAKGRAGPRAVGLLSRREIEVLRLVGEGLSNRDIAARLFISPKTAEHHLSRVYAKLGVAGRAEAATYAVRHLGSE
jgi:DNA-binding NarL/FixJ family response regulator